MVPPLNTSSRLSARRLHLPAPHPSILPILQACRACVFYHEHKCIWQRCNGSGIVGGSRGEFTEEAVQIRCFVNGYLDLTSSQRPFQLATY